MANIYTPGIYVAGTSTRLTQAKLDIQDLIVNIDVHDTPLFSALKHNGADDMYPAIVTDSLNAIDTTSQPYAGTAKAANDTARALVRNYCERLSETVTVGDEQNAIAQYGINPNEMAYQKPKKALELKRSIENILISDQVLQAPTTANSSRGEMNGMSVIIATNTSNAFSQANFDTMMAAIWLLGGRPTVAYMDTTRKIAVGAWASNVQRIGYAAKDLEQEVLHYHSDVGPTVTMNAHPYMPTTIDGGNDAHFMFIEPGRWQIKELIRFHWEDLAFLGGSKSGQWVWNGTILCSAEQANGMFY